MGSVPCFPSPTRPARAVTFQSFPTPVGTEHDGEATVVADGPEAVNACHLPLPLFRALCRRSPVLVSNYRLHDGNGPGRINSVLQRRLPRRDHHMGQVGHVPKLFKYLPRPDHPSELLQQPGFQSHPPGVGRCGCRPLLPSHHRLQVELHHLQLQLLRLSRRLRARLFRLSQHDRVLCGPLCRVLAARREALV